MGKSIAGRADLVASLRQGDEPLLAATAALLDFERIALPPQPDEPLPTALGAAYLAGLGIGFWSNQAQLSSMWRNDRAFSPSMTEGTRKALYRRWRRAVQHSRGWAYDEN